MSRSKLVFAIICVFFLTACQPVAEKTEPIPEFPTMNLLSPEDMLATYEKSLPTITSTPLPTLTPTATPYPPLPSLEEVAQEYQSEINPLYAVLETAQANSDYVLSLSSTWQFRFIPGSEREYLIQYLLFGERTFGNPNGQTQLYITYSYQREGCLSTIGFSCDIQKSKVLSKLVVKDGSNYYQLEELPPFSYGIGASNSAEIISQSVNSFNQLGDQAAEIKRTMEVMMFYLGGLDPVYDGRDIVQPAVNTRVAILKLVLSSPSWTDRRAALHSLETIGPEGVDALPEIIQALNDEDTEVKRRAVNVLGSIGPEAMDAVPELIKSLQEQDEGLRCDVFTALGNIGEDAKETIPLMISELESDGNCQDSAMKALAKFGSLSAPAIPALEKILNNDQSGYLQTTAAQTLGDIGEPALDALITALGNDDTTIRYIAANAIEKIGPAASAAVPALTKALQESEKASAYTYFNALGNIGPGASQAVPVLVEFLKDVDLQEDAVKTLGKIGPAALESVPELINLLDNESYMLRYDARDALRNITGQDFGFQKEDWQAWWVKNKP